MPTPPRRTVSLTFAVLGLLGARALLAQQARPPRALRDLPAYASQAVTDWGIPGLAIAVVKDDSVVFAQGFGVRKLGDPAPVTPRTLFAIGSCTKAFTAATLAMLADSGKLAWDDPVTQYLKGFQLYDPYVTRELTVRDLLTHRSGLMRGDALWYATPYDRDEVLRRIRYLKPSWSFRSRYGYQNIMFLAAGQLVPAVTGMTWDDFVQRRLFAPLGMTATNTSVTALARAADVATPHERVAGKEQPVAWRNIDNIGPAGAINSNVLDMAQWLRLQLGTGSYRGARLISAAAMKEMHAPQTLVPLDSDKSDATANAGTLGPRPKNPGLPATGRSGDDGDGGSSAFRSTVPILKRNNIFRKHHFESIKIINNRDQS